MNRILLGVFCLLAVSVAYAGDTSTGTITAGLSFSMQAEVVSNKISPYFADYMTGEEFLAKLRSAQRMLEGKPVSNEETADGLTVAGYIGGLYRGFMQGAYAEGYIEAYRKTGKINLRYIPPVCTKTLDMKTVISSLINTLEKNDPAGRLPSWIVIKYFLDNGYYVDCK